MINELGLQGGTVTAAAAMPAAALGSRSDAEQSMTICRKLGDTTKRRKLAYQLMRADVVRWLLTRTDVHGQVQSVLVAEHICILAYGVEFFVKSLKRFELPTAWFVGVCATNQFPLIQ